MIQDQFYQQKLKLFIIKLLSTLSNWLFGFTFVVEVLGIWLSIIKVNNIFILLYCKLLLLLWIVLHPPYNTIDELYWCLDPL